MEHDWKIYCLMSAIIYIEEMTKPNPRVQIKKYKNSEYRCTCYSSIRLKMKDAEFVNKFFQITKQWEYKKKLSFVGKSFKTIRRENYSGQYMFLLTPIWLNVIISECGRLPNLYSFQTAKDRINHFVQYSSFPIDEDKNLFDLLLRHKKLAAGAFIVSMDLECRGIQNGDVSLCMSEKFKDFLEFMLKVADKWGWSTSDSLFKVSVDYSRNLGINASPQFEFGLSIHGLKEVYSLAGPLSIEHKDKCVKFNINRSNNYLNLGYNLIKNKTKQKIFESLQGSKNMTSTQLQFIAGVRVDVILDHLHKLEREGLATKIRSGKRYLWNVK